MSIDSTPGTDVAYLHSSLQERKAYAAALAQAGELVPPGFRNRDGSPNPAKLLLAFEYGAMLGIHPMAAVKGINVIEGQTGASPALMTGLVRQAGHKIRIDKTGTWKDGTFTATVTLIRSDDPQHPFTAVWDAERAKQAGLLPASSPRASWNRYPQNMCVWRAVSEVCREGAEDVLFGLHYTPEELGAEVNDAGEVIDGEIVEDEPGPRHTGESKARLRDPAVTGPDAQPTRTGANRPSPSRTVETSGAGRAPKPEEPSEETRAAVAEYVERIAAEDDIERLRDLHGDASTHGLLATPVGDGRRLNDVFYQRREAILQAQEMPPALDGIEDEDGDPV